MHLKNIRKALRAELKRAERSAVAWPSRRDHHLGRASGLRLALSMLDRREQLLEGRA